MSMMHWTSIVTVVAILILSEVSSAWALGDVQKGRVIAERWCSSCHLVSRDQTSASGDAPSFASISERSQSGIDSLAGFIADAHPPMPKLSLTRDEIRNLLAYIASLRH
jgi:mono/diheme cytochrome c family protein